MASDPDTIHNIYQIQYTGNGNDLPPDFTEQQLDDLKIWYTKKAQEIQTETGEMSHSDLQALFSATLKRMNINNVVLFRTKDINTIKKVSFDQYNNPTEDDCL